MKGCTNFYQFFPQNLGQTLKKVPVLSINEYQHILWVTSFPFQKPLPNEKYVRFLNICLYMLLLSDTIKVTLCLKLRFSSCYGCAKCQWSILFPFTAYPFLCRVFINRGLLIAQGNFRNLFFKKQKTLIFNLIRYLEQPENRGLRCNWRLQMWLKDWGVGIGQAFTRQHFTFYTFPVRENKFSSQALLQWSEAYIYIIHGSPTG